MDDSRNQLRTIILILVMMLLPGSLAAHAAGVVQADTVRHDAGDDWTVEQIDEYIRSVFTEKREDEYEEAVRLYMGMILAAGEATLGPTDQAIVDRHMFFLNLIAARSVMERVCVNMPEAGRLRYGEFQVKTPMFSCAFGEGSRDELVRWWRSQDPLPATIRNERIEEHLLRVEYARENYPSHTRSEGVDDRGLVYVRYGEPDRRIRVRPAMDSSVMRMINTSPSVSLSDFPNGEFWVYARVSRDAHYLFVEDKREYQFAEANDFVPRRLSGRHAHIYLNALHVALRDLALYHIDYSSRFNELDTFLMTYGLPGPQNLNAQGMAHVITARNETEDRHIDARRAELPQESSDVLRTYEPLPVQVRTARFLDEDGNTRIEMYWSHPPEPFRLNRRERRWLRRELGEPEIDSYLISLATSISSGDYAHRHVDHSQYRLTKENAESGYPTQVQTVTLDAVYSDFHFGAQWDGHFVFATDDGEAEIGPQIKQVTLRRDTLSELNRRGDRIEMSDLKPLFAEGSRHFSDQTGTPYPFRGVSPSISVALYFELYHLAPDDEGRSHYSVSYEIVRQRDPEGLLRLRRFDPESVTAEYDVTTTGTTAEEYIELNLSEWDAAGVLTVNVTVTDRNSAESVQRSIEFDFVEDAREVHFTRTVPQHEEESDGEP